MGVLRLRVRWGGCTRISPQQSLHTLQQVPKVPPSTAQTSRQSPTVV